MTNAIKIVYHASGVLSGAPFVDYKKLVFSGGEVQIRLIDPPDHTHSLPAVVKLYANIRSSENLMELLLVTDAMRRIYPNINIVLQLGYLPYARQDRVCEKGEALSLAVFCKIINSQNYQTVLVWDCHSDVGLALLDRVVHVEQAWCIKKVLYTNDDKTSYVLVAPDAGASKKIVKVASVLEMPFIQADKKRDSNTGAISGTTVPDIDPTKHYLIVDDICDGGATFIALAAALRAKGASDVSLYVTHGIFSRGLEPLAGFNRIYCDNSWLPQQANLFTLTGKQET